MHSRLKPLSMFSMKDELPESFKRMLRKLGRKGGKRRLETMTPEQRRKQAKKAIKARWAKRPRKFFAALGYGLNTCIFEMRRDGAYRSIPLSILTKKERQRCGEIIQLLTAGSDFCALKSPNFPKEQSVAVQTEEFVCEVERRHGEQTWRLWSEAKLKAGK